VTVLRRLRPTILDRYIVQEMLPPTGLGLLLFTFILLLQQITLLVGALISRGADFPTVIRVFYHLLPSIFSVTIPMAFLLGVLLAFGRMGSDSELVALRASGVSPATLLRPVVALATLTGLSTFYIMAVSLPAANQAHRQIMFSLLVSKARTGFRPRVFIDDLVPGMVFYLSDIPAETGLWKDVFIHDVRVPQKPRVILARSGRLVIDEPHKAVSLHLESGTIHTYEPPTPDSSYEHQRFSTADLPLPFEQFFPQLTVPRGDREMTLAELADHERELRAAGKPPLEYARFRVEWHKKFAIPVACFVFGLLGLGLSLGNRKEARSAAYGLSIAVIFVYYVIIRLGEQAGKTGLMVPWLSMWGANMILGAGAIVLLILNFKEAAFDPLDPAHYAAWIPRIRSRRAAPAAAAPPRPPARLQRPLPLPPRRVVVVRLPRFVIRFPGILDRYIARAYLGHFALVLAAFVSFTMLAEFLDLFDDVQQNHVKGVVMVHYMIFHTPFWTHMIAPFAVLVATLTTFGILARRNEMTAMKAGGISVYRSTLAVMLLGAATSVVLIAMGEFLLPHTNQIAGRDFNVIKGRPPQSSSPLEHRWIVGHDGRLYNFEYFVETTPSRGNPGEFTLYGLSVYDVNARNWDLRDRLYAKQASWHGLTWELQEYWRRSFGARAQPYESHDSGRTAEIEPPSYFKRDDKESDAMGFWDLKGHIALLQAKGLDVTKLRIQLHKKPATPGQAVVMTLIGIPFAFVVGRRGALYGVGISIFIAIIYWSCIAIFEALGNNALLHPVLAAWAPNLLFAAAGLYLMFHLET
jgi:LPS export ABC transporter permease LptG/LPS export ABC transporter permease LptF